MAHRVLPPNLMSAHVDRTVSWTNAGRTIPCAAEDRYLVVDAERDATFLLLRVENEKHVAVWRADGDGDFVHLGKAGFPYVPYFGYAFFDPVADAPAFFGASYDSESSPLCGTLDGLEFRSADSKGATFTSYCAAAYDARRRVLVQVVSPKEDGPAVVREIADGIVREMGMTPVATTSQAHDVLGFDAAQGRMYWASSTAGDAFFWDGKHWTPAPSPPFRFAYRDHVATQASGGRLAVLFPPQVGNKPAELYVLGDDGWTKIDLGPHAPVAAAYDSKRDALVLFTNGGLLRVRNDQIEIVRPPPPLHGRAIFSAQSALLFGWKSCARFDGESAPVAEPLSETFVDAYVAVGEHEIGVTREGAIVRRCRGTIETVAAAPADFEPRIWSAVAWDAVRDKLVLAGGEQVQGSRKLAQTWESDGRASLTLVKAKGRAPAERAALMLFDPSRGVSIMVGGVKDSNDTPSGKTWEYDGKSWTAFDTQFRGKRQPKPHCLAFDPRTQQTVLVLNRTYDARETLLYVYRGEGAWELAATIEPPLHFATTAIAYDPTARHLVSWGELGDGSGGVGSRVAAIGDVLDAVASGPVTTAPAAARASSVTKATKAASAFSPERFLQYRDGTSDKVWFANLSGKSFTARWGRRGAKLTEKTYPFADAALAKAAFEKAVAEKLAKGYEDAPTGAAANTVAGKKAFVIKLGKAPAPTDDRFGGAPVGVSGDAWPICAGCKTPMPHVATFHGDAARLPLEKHAALAVFACDGAKSGGTCESWQAFGGANGVVLLPKRAKAARAERTAKAGQSAGRAILYTERFEKDPVAEESDDDERKIVSKVGGYPNWLQDDEAPCCRECKQPMEFVAQIDSALDDSLNFGDAGVGYVFVCKEEHCGAFLWQCG